MHSNQMKANLKFTISFCCLLGASMHSSFSQSFVNLDFNSANIPIGTSPSFVPIAEAIPGWTAYYGNLQQTSVFYDGLATGSVNISILDENNVGLAPIPGNNYTVVLEAGNGNDGGNGGLANTTASIAQTAMIPSTAESIVFTASIPNGGGWLANNY